MIDRIVTTGIVIGVVILALSIYLHIWRVHGIHSPSIILMFGITGVARGGRLTRLVIHYEATILLLISALLFKTFFENEIFHRALELIASFSLLLCTIIFFKSFKRAEEFIKSNNGKSKVHE